VTWCQASWRTASPPSAASASWQRCREGA